MQTKTRVVATALASGTIAFLLNGQTPLGRLLWPPHEGGLVFTDLQLAFLIGATIAGAALFGLGVAFLAFAGPLLARTPAPPALARAGHLALGSILVGPFLHDNLHMHYGENVWALVALGWIFHVGVGLAAVVVAAFALRAAPAGVPALAREAAVEVRAVPR